MIDGDIDVSIDIDRYGSIDMRFDIDIDIDIDRVWM